ESIFSRTQGKIPFDKLRVRILRLRRELSRTLSKDTTLPF
ncbi:MAG: hypothetical protein ACI85U_003447, partial [Candidatus Promineifilaceae bacterium]